MTRLSGMEQLKYAVPAISLLALMLMVAAQVRAHGIGTPQVINELAGPYIISIWTDPDPLRVGEAHVTVAVMDSETESPILDARVLVELTWLDDPSILLTAPATRENATLKIVYVAIFEPPQAGEWQGTVLVDGPNGSGVVAPFTVSILSPARINWSLIGGLALGLLMAGWMVWSWFDSRGSNGRNEP